MNIDNARALKKAFKGKMSWKNIIDGVVRYNTRMTVKFNVRRLISNEDMRALKSFWYAGRRVCVDDIAISITDLTGYVHYTKYNKPLTLNLDGGVATIEVNERIRLHVPLKAYEGNAFWNPAPTGRSFDMKLFFQNILLPTELEMVALSIDEPDLYEAVLQRKSGVKTWQLVH